MSTELTAMLNHLDAALENAKQRRYRSRERAMHIVVAPEKPEPAALLGCVGHVAQTLDDGHLLVTFTTKQVRAMRRYVANALAEEARNPSPPLLIVDDPAVVDRG